LKSIAGGCSPENFTGLIQKASPQLILIIDAADLKRRPGKVALLSPQEMSCLVHSTHTIPISLLTAYLESTTGATVKALGIQPKRIDFGVPMSEEVSSGVREVVHVLRAAF
jgi:hydrogenase 3 maturation protease